MRKITFSLLTSLSLVGTGCVQTISEDTSTYCTTTVDAAAALTNQALCTPTGGPGRHFRVESVDATPATMGNATTTSRYYQIGVGYEANKTSSFTNSTTAGDGKFYLAGGRHVSPGEVITWYDFGGQSTSNDANLKYADYYSAAKTLCFDISSSAPPKITVWVDGVSGANCFLRSTLNAANAQSAKSDWSSATPANFNGSNYIRITGSVAPRLSVGKVTVFATAALQ